MSTKKSDKSLEFLEALTGEKLTLASLLSAVREGEELSQVEFAKKLGVSRQYVCDLEHDRRSVSVEMAAKFANLLGYPQEQFIRLSLQSQLDKVGLLFSVDIKKTV